MAWWKKEDDKKAVDSKKSVESLTKDQRLQVEDLLDHDWLAKEIADELGIEVAQVSRIKDIRSRIKKTSQPTATKEDDELESKRKEIALAKLEAELDEIIHKKEIRRIEREIKLAELEGDDEEEWDDPRIAMMAEADNPDRMFEKFMMMKMMQGMNGAPQQTAIQPPQQQQVPQTTTQPTKPVESPQISEEQLAQVKAAVKSGVISKKTFISRGMKTFGLTKEEAEKKYMEFTQ